TTRYVAWPKGVLATLLKRNPTMDVAVQSVLSTDLIQKLSGNSNPDQKNSKEPSTQESASG
ncbi:MAG TPA: hypothetical protein DDZ83_15540, partial [Nitrospinae bacterium]|nr:hypothetical protein [Nitrospinota bacterium]